MKKICVIGDGAWGTATALTLHKNQHNVTVWGAFEENIRKILESRENRSFLPGVSLPPEISWTAERREAVIDAEIVVMAVPSKYYVATAESFSGLFADSCSLVSLTKGIARTGQGKTGYERMSEAAERILGIEEPAALSGPSHAEEVARNVPTAVTIACRNREKAALMQSVFGNRRFRVYTSDDVTGVELGGVLKNIVAVAVGISDGIGFGDNTRAAIMTRGLAEIIRLGTALGAKKTTFAGLSGIGDLIVTCTSSLSRNRSAGDRIGKGENPSEILSNSQQAVEGLWNCASALDLAKQTGIDMPITQALYSIVHEEKAPVAAVEELLQRNFKTE